MKTAIKYPNMNDYQEALQHPELKFKDHRLKSCNIEKDPMGMPKVRSGGFALTYKLVNSNKRWAVRCFHKPLADREKRYALISSYLNSKKSPILINVEYLPDEILVKGNRHPVTLMDWIDGDTLSQYLYKNAGKPSKLANLVGEFLFVVDELERLQIAHGDLSHLNIIIKNEKMILIDYDGLFVPTIQGWKSAELGNRNFQHPLRKSDHFDSNIDRFSEIVIYLALYGIALSPKLFNKYGAGAEGLLFKVNDFLKPHESPLLRDLEAIPELKQLVKQCTQIERFAWRTGYLDSAGNIINPILFRSPIFVNCF
jgi:serine/threonine protein kinase